MRYHVYTIRNGRELLGNVGHINTIWTDLKTDKGAIRRTLRLIPNEAKIGDIICVVAANNNRPYCYDRHVASLSYWGHNGPSPVITVSTS